MLHLTGCEVEHLFFSFLQETPTFYQASGLCRYLWSKPLGPLALFFVLCYASSRIFCLCVLFLCQLLSNSTTN